MSTLLDCERCILYVFDPTSGQLQTKAVRGPRIERFSVPPDKGIIGAVYSTRNGIILKSPYEDTRFDRTLDQKRKSLTRNMICVPLKMKGNCIGCLEVANKRGSVFSEQDYQLTAAVAKELAAGLFSKKFKIAAEGMAKEKAEFKEKVKQVANENLLTPLLKNVLIILAEIIKCER